MFERISSMDMILGVPGNSTSPGLAKGGRSFSVECMGYLKLGCRSFDPSGLERHVREVFYIIYATQEKRSVLSDYSQINNTLHANTLRLALFCFF